MGFDVRRWQVRDWLVLAGGLLLLAVSLNTWVGLNWLLGNGSIGIRYGYLADAWHSSAMYETAVCLGLAAVVGWLAAAGLAARPASVRPVTAAALGLSLALVLLRHAFGPARLTTVTSVTAVFGPSEQANRLDSDLVQHRTGVGWYAGLAVLAALLLIVVWRRSPVRPGPSGAEPPAGPVTERLRQPSDIGRRDLGWAVGAVGVLLLVVSLTGWYGTDWQQSGSGGARIHRTNGNAWQSSTPWTLGTCAGLYASALWLSYRGRTDRPRWLRGFVLALLGAAALLVGWPLDRLSDSGRTLTARVQHLVVDQVPPRSAAAINRDRLVDYSIGPDYRSGRRAGAYAGLVLLAGQAVLVAVDSRRTPPPEPPAEPEPPARR